ncbi:MAG: alpha/beta fold hydrolase [Clostridiales bacterium]|nr:alpha/beta fold hydrolase [Clostridiales bacterium]
MRRIILISLLLIIFVLTSCGTKPQQRSVGPLSYTVKAPSVTELTKTEGLVTFYRDDKEIEGKIFLPDSGSPAPVIIMSTGLYALYPEYEKKARDFTDKGFAAIVFNFVSNADANSDKTVKDQNIRGLMASQVLDLAAVMDSLPSLGNVDSTVVYLWGHSYGGLISAYAGAMRQDEVKGLILVEPALNNGPEELVPGDPDTMTDINEVLSSCDLNTLIFAGSKSKYGSDPGAYDAVLDSLRNAEFIRIEGADHLFAGEYGEEMVDKTCEKIDSWRQI